MRGGKEGWDQACYLKDPLYGQQFLLGSATPMTVLFAGQVQVLAQRRQKRDA